MALSEEIKERIRQDYLKWSGGFLPHKNVDENGTHETYALCACGVPLHAMDVWDFIDEWVAELESSVSTPKFWYD